MKKRSFFSFLKNIYFIIFVVIVVVGALGYYVTHRSSTSKFEWTSAAIGEVIEQVSVTGTVSPVDKAALAFQKSGVIASIPVKVGDAVKKGDLIASLNSAADKAALANAQATLAEISRGLRPEEYAADQSAVDTASTTLANAQKDAVNAIHSGFTQAQSAVVNFADTFFANPQTVNPTITIHVTSNIISTNINNERLAISATLNNWQGDAASATIGNAQGLISNAEGYISSIKSFLNDLSAIVNALNPGNSAMSQSAIDAFVTTMNTALSTLNQSVATVSAADTELKNALSTYNQAQNNFALQQAGSSADQIAAQAAKVAQAKADLGNDQILAPIDGIVTQADPTVGEFAAAGAGGFAVESSGQYKIEAYVPEADIAKVAVGDLASSTLDAYGSYVDFPAIVTAIDPSETVLQGVPTYKVTLYFVTPDPRIRSGMTANLEILTHEADNVVSIPYRAVTVSATSTAVRIVSADLKTYYSIPVITGLKGSNGMIEIKSGLNEGDKVVTYVK